MNINIFLHEQNLESVVCLIVFGLVFCFVSLCFSVVYRAFYFYFFVSFYLFFKVLLLSELDITRFFLCKDDKLDLYFQTIVCKENIFWELFLCLFV